MRSILDISEFPCTLYCNWSKRNEADDKNDLSHVAVEYVDFDRQSCWLAVSIAVKVHHDIKVTPSHNSVGGIDMKYVGKSSSRKSVQA